MALYTPEYLQTKKYSALRDRLVLQHGGQIQAGVWDATDFQATQRGAGANLSVDVGVGYALVPANDAGNAGLYHLYNDAAVNVALTAAHATLPRIDSIIARVNDTTHGGDASDVSTLEVVTGTATTGATLDNRTGAGALPTGALRLCDVLVGAAVTSVTNANIRDRRSWARGFRYVRTNVGTDILVTSASLIELDATNIRRRFEATGNPVRVTLDGTVKHSNAGFDGQVTLYQNGAEIAGMRRYMTTTTANYGVYLAMKWDFVPAAGSILLSPYAATPSGGTFTFLANATYGLNYTVEEIVRQNIDNNSVTSG